jgi:hypothetical protein
VHAEGLRPPGRKKLKEAARAWATGGAPLDEDNTLAALTTFNATEQQLEEVRAELDERRRAAVVEVWPENWRAFELFSAMGTSWNRVAVGGLGGGQVLYVGLDLAQLGAIERWLPLEDGDDAPPDRRTLFSQIKLLEGEALQHLNA